jgi:hypothetical protein
MAVSPKVSAATVGAAFTTIIAGILGPHLFPHATASDVQGLVEAVVTAAVTFGSGFLARDAQRVEAEVSKTVQPEVRAAQTVYTKVEQSAPAVADVAKALEAAEAPRVSVPTSVAVPVAKPLA